MSADGPTSTSRISVVLERDAFGSLAWIPIGLGLLILYVPTLVDLFSDVWGTAEQAHGPIVFLIAAWLLVSNWSAMCKASEERPPSAAGWPVFLIGLFLYVLGRSQSILSFEVGSAIWMIAGTVLLLWGSAALKVQWFPLFFMLFMIPLPGSITDWVTMPLKMAVSHVAETLMFWWGYPISRSGVILQIGVYQLLVADACAGLHTLLALEAMGILYLELVRRDSLLRNVALGVLIVPISFAANVVRVILLTLITYYFGEDAGQGFLHGFSGLVLYVSALLLTFAADSLINLGFNRPYRSAAGGAP